MAFIGRYTDMEKFNRYLSADISAGISADFIGRLDYRSYSSTHQTGLASASFLNKSSSSFSALSVMPLLLLFHAFLMSSWCLNFFCALSLVYSIRTSFFHFAVSLDGCCADDDAVPGAAAGEEVEPLVGG